MSHSEASNASLQKNGLSLSIIILACAIAYLGYALLRVAEQVPEVLTESEYYRVLLPEVLDDSKVYLKLVPDVLAEVSEIRKSLPDLYQRVDKAQIQVDQLSAQIPAILSSWDAGVVVVGDASNSVNAVVPLVPEILNESQQIRGELPAHIARVEQLVVNAKQVTEDAGFSAVKGVFKGIITTPLDLISGAEDRIRGAFASKEKITEEDAHMIIEAAKLVVVSQTVNVQPWSNPESGNSGEVALVKHYVNDKTEACMMLDVRILFADGEDGTSEKILKPICQNSEGSWYDNTSE